MNLKSLGMFLALAAIGASCTNDDLMDDSGTRIPEGRAEIQVNFSGSGESQEYSTTRAIASDSENRIDKLEVYLFASDAQDGTYRFLEKWDEGTAYDAANPTDLNFKKIAAGTGWKASLYPGELKGLPWIKLLCVVNNGVDGHTGIADGKFYDEGDPADADPAKATAKADPVKVEVDADGNVTNPDAATTEAEFKKAFTRYLDPADHATGVIEVPLMMTGEGVTKISGSVSKVNIDLRRTVARFDIENDKSKSNLTIESVTLNRGRRNGALWGTERTVVASADFATSAFLADYTTIDFKSKTGANKGVVESVFYAYPNLDSDQAYLVVKGTYKSPVTSVEEPVVYNIDLAATPEGSDMAKFISLKANSRYRLKIMDVTKSHIFATFEVVDWTSGGGIDVKPDNDAPVFDPAIAFLNTQPAGNIPVDLNAANPEAVTSDYEVVGEAGSFKLMIAATGKVRAEKAPLTVTRADESAAYWIDFSTVECTEKDGVWYSEFTVNYSGAVGARPVAVNFINDAASFDPELWTTVNFYGPKQVPLFYDAAAPNATGNSVDVTDEKAPKATLYRTAGSFVMLDVKGGEGIQVLKQIQGINAEEVKAEGDVHTYKVSVTDAKASTVSGSIVFANKGDITKTTDLAITVKDAAMTFSVSAPDAAVQVTADPADANGYIPGQEVKIDLAALVGKTFMFRVTSPIALTTPDLTCPELTIVDAGHAWSEESPYMEFNITPSGTSSTEAWTTLTFKNPLSMTEPVINAPALEIRLKKDFTKPIYSAGGTTASWSAFNQEFMAAATATEIEMYRVNNSAVTVSVDCSNEEVEFADVAGVTVAQIGKTDEYTVTVTDTALLANKKEVALTVYNKKAKEAETDATTRKATIKLKMKDAAMSYELTSNAGGSAVIDGTDKDKIVLDYGTFQYAPVVITVKGYKGSTIAVSSLADHRLSGTQPAQISEDGTAVLNFANNAGGTGTGDVTVTITSAIGGPQKVITISAKP